MMERTLNMSCTEYLRRPDKDERRKEAANASHSFVQDTLSRKPEKRRKASARTSLAAKKIRLMKLLIGAILLTVIISICSGAAAHAGNQNVTYAADEYVYKMITVKEGDSLWNIGREWSFSTADDIRTWIGNVKEMNHLINDTIREGQTLLIYCGDSLADKQ